MASEYPLLVEDMPFPEYLADPAPGPSLTSSIARDLLQTCPEVVRLKTPRLNPDARPTHKSAFDIGSAAHAELVGGGEPIVEIDARDWRTKAAKQARDEARADGFTPLLAKDAKRVREMAAAARERFKGTAAEIAFCHPEVTMAEATIVWRRHGVWCRCRPDVFVPVDAPVLVHYKTTSTKIHPRSMARFAATAGWHVIHAHYAYGIKAVTGVDVSQVFAVQETRPPYVCLVAALDSAFKAHGELEHNRALDTWAACVQSDTWPGFGTETVELRAPAWLDYTAEDDEDSEDFGGL